MSNQASDPRVEGLGASPQELITLKIIQTLLREPYPDFVIILPPAT